MSQKRQPEDGKPPSEGTSSDDKRRKLPSLHSVVREVMRLREAQKFLEPVLEPLIRRVVKEEVDLSLRKYMTNMKWNHGKETQSSESRNLQLQFLNTLSLPVFTGTRIEGEDCSTLKVALFDALTRQVVCNRQESSAKVEIVVLEGDFDGDEGNKWTIEEFKNNIVREREGKKPLLHGEALLYLKDGTGLVGEISFTDNSSWTRSRKFRLGARVVDSCDGIRVREAKTESFIVRDHRGELYKKHHPPSLFDDVWRLEKIGKEGAFHKRLGRENVKTVQDFLTLLYLDPSRLRNVLGTGMSTKMWEVTMEHAKTCILDKKLYMYCPSPQQKNRVVFNVVGQLMGLFSDGNYVSADNLLETEKADAQNMILSAFKHWNEVLPYDDMASLVGSSSVLENVNFPSNSSSDMTDRFDYPQLSAPSPDMVPSIFSMGNMSSLDDYGLQSIDSVRFDQPLTFPVPQDFCDEHLQYFDTDVCNESVGLGSEADLHTAVNGFLMARSAVAVKAQKRWRKLFRVLKWSSMLRSLIRKSPVRDLSH